MTRINTNVSSLQAQNYLAKSHSELDQALTRLSTGLRINSGQDDPSGLIAAQTLSSAITSSNKAISNTQTATQMVSTADSALGQVSTLLNNIRGLVTESANTGALSSSQIAADQLTVDSSLDAINRIAQSTSFQGRNLLDGSLDFTVQQGTNYSTVKDLQINQATLNSANQMAVNVNVTAAATQATLTNSAQTANNTVATLNFGGVGFHLGTTDNLGGIDFVQTSNSATPIKITVAAGTAATTASAASYTAGTNSLAITLATTGTTTEGALMTLLNASAVTTVANMYYYNGTANSTKTFDSTAALAQTNFTGSSLTITANNQSSTYNNMSVKFVTSAGAATSAAYNSTANTLTVTVNNSSGSTINMLDIANNIAAQGFTVQINAGTQTTNQSGARLEFIGNNTSDTGTSTNANFMGGTVLRDSLTLQVSGSLGAQVFNFSAGTTMDQVASAINLLTSSTNVKATNNNGTLTFNSSDYGSAALVDVQVMAEGANGSFANGLAGTTRAYGTDIQGNINGYNAQGAGNTLSLSTSSLAMAVTVNNGSSSALGFTINGGGAVFQLGATVGTAQQAHLGITAVNTAKLGGAAGKLYQIGSGGTASLSTNPNTAGQIVDQVVNKIASLRGRLGAFQQATLQTNLSALTDQVQNLTTAQSNIQDADFAAESANLTRAQILVQSGTSVLQITNQAPQSVLKLLGG